MCTNNSAICGDDKDTRYAQLKEERQADQGLTSEILQWPGTGVSRNQPALRTPAVHAHRPVPRLLRVAADQKVLSPTEDPRYSAHGGGPRGKGEASVLVTPPPTHPYSQQPCLFCLLDTSLFCLLDTTRSYKNGKRVCFVLEEFYYLAKGQPCLFYRLWHTANAASKPACTIHIQGIHIQAQNIHALCLDR